MLVESGDYVFMQVGVVSDYDLLSLDAVSGKMQV